MNTEDDQNFGQPQFKLPLGTVAFILILALAGLTVLESLYTVPSDSVGVVLRFGKYIKEVDPGLAYKIPWGIDSVLILPVRRQLKQEFGFTTPGGTNASQGSIDPEREKAMVTGDLNAVQVEWVVQYRISAPFDFLFKVRNAEMTLRAISESVMREVVGDRTVDEVLTIGRQEIESESLVKMQNLAKKYDVGVSIDQVQLKNVNPPDPVQDSFNEVNQAQQEKERLIYDARREYNKSIPLALGTKDRSIQEAEGYRIQRVNRAQGDAARFNSVLVQYLKAPEVTKFRIYLETLQNALNSVASKTFVDENLKSILPLLKSPEKKEGEK